MFEYYQQRFITFENARFARKLSKVITSRHFSCEKIFWKKPCFVSLFCQKKKKKKNGYTWFLNKTTSCSTSWRKKRTGTIANREIFPNYRLLLPFGAPFSQDLRNFEEPRTKKKKNQNIRTSKIVCESRKERVQERLQHVTCTSRSTRGWKNSDEKKKRKPNRTRLFRRLFDCGGTILYTFQHARSLGKHRRFDDGRR